MNKNASLKYIEQGSMTATPGELLMLLLNAEIKNIRVAILRIHDKKLEEAHNCLVKAQDIMNELILSLDDSFALSKELTALYTFIRDELVAANIKKDAAKLEALIPVVTQLRDTWEEAKKIAKA